MTKDDLIDDKNEISVPSATWEKEGMSYRGILVEVKTIPTKDSKIYTLAEATKKADDKSDAVDIEGGVIQVWGRRGTPKVIPELELCQLGQEVAIKFVRQDAPTKPGQSGVKKIHVYTKGTIKQDVLDKFLGLTAPTSDQEEIAKAAEEL